MQVIIQPSAISGNIYAPASKSSMQRACAAALIRKGESVIHNPGVSNDDKAALDVIRALGAAINNLSHGTLQIISEGINPVSDTVNCGESGLGIRMFAPIIALSEKNMIINGERSLLSRPMDFFDEVLPQLNIEVLSNNGKLPLKLKGPLQPKNIEIDGSLSSQFLTGLLFAYAASDAKDVTIKVTNLKSKPYVDLTLKVMQDFGLKVPENNSYKSFYFSSLPANHKPQAVHYTVEGDWSGGAFLLVAGAIAGDIVIKGLDLSSTQADKAVLQALIDCGAKISIESEQIKIGHASLKAFNFNATDCPDLFPPLVALASYCEGTSVIEGVHRLTHKESNRALTLKDEFGKMGVEIKFQNNLMLIKADTGVRGAHVHSRHDHRIAMACAVAALKAEAEMVIDEAEAVAKSYPNFYEHIQKLGTSLNYSKVENLKDVGIINSKQ